MSSYLRSWLSAALPVAQSSQEQSDVIVVSSPPLPEDINDSDNDTVRGDSDQDDDQPPAFPSLNSAQRVETDVKTEPKQKADGIPDILRPDSSLMLPPPPPSLATRRPGVSPPSSSSSSLSVSGSLRPPPTTTKAPTRKSRKVELAPGYGPLDWGNLKKSGKNLRGVESLIRIPMSVLKQHNKRDDAWSAFNGKVYNITPYLSFHPGGEKELLRVAGRDGTKLFALTHAWVNVDFMLDECLVGFLIPDHSN